MTFKKKFVFTVNKACKQYREVVVDMNPVSISQGRLSVVGFV